MIDDLLTDLTIGALHELLSSQTPQDEADFGLARINARLRPLTRLSGAKGEQSGSDGSAVEAQILNQYLALSLEDLERITPSVHEWLLERPSLTSATYTATTTERLIVLYFLVTEGTVRHAVIGTLLHWDTTSHEDAPGAYWSRVILNGYSDPELPQSEREHQIRLYSDILIDFVTTFPAATERAIAQVNGLHDDVIVNHLRAWADRLGGESGEGIRRALRPT